MRRTTSQRLLCRIAVALPKFDRATSSRYGGCANNPGAIKMKCTRIFVTRQSLMESPSLGVTELVSCRTWAGPVRVPWRHSCARQLTVPPTWAQRRKAFKFRSCPSSVSDFESESYSGYSLTLVSLKLLDLGHTSMLIRSQDLWTYGTSSSSYHPLYSRGSQELSGLP